MARKSMILKDFKSFRRILLRGVSTEAIFTPGRGDISRFGTAFETGAAVCVSKYHRVIEEVNGNTHLTARFLQMEFE